MPNRPAHTSPHKRSHGGDSRSPQRRAQHSIRTILRPLPIKLPISGYWTGTNMGSNERRKPKLVRAPPSPPPSPLPASPLPPSRVFTAATEFVTTVTLAAISSLSRESSEWTVLASVGNCDSHKWELL